MNLRKNKSTAAVQKARRDIVSLLKGSDDEKARIMAEQALKEENLTKAFEELQGICEEILSRLGIINSSRRLPLELKIPICTVIWSSTCLNIKELDLMRQQFALKFGANLDHEALCNIDNCVDSNIQELLSPMPPDESIVFSYLKGVAEEFSIDWGNTENDDENGMEEESSLQDIYGSFMGKSSKSTSNDISVDDLPDIGGISLEKASKDISNVNLDDFDSMFAPIPTKELPTAPIIEPEPIKSVTPSIIPGAVSLKPKKIEQSVQRVQTINPTPKQGIQSVQKVQQVSSNTGNISKIELKKQMGKDLAEMDSKDLEAEFEELFNCSFNEETPAEKIQSSTIQKIQKVQPVQVKSVQPVKQSISLEKVENVQKTSSISLLKDDVNLPKEEYTQEHISTTTNSEFDDLFSAPAPEENSSQISSNWDLDGPNDGDYDDIFARLSSVSNNSPSQSNEEEKKEEGVTIIDDEMSAEEWAKRFDTNTGSSNSYTFQFSSTPIEPTPIQPTNQSTPQDIDDDIMRRFKAL